MRRFGVPSIGSAFLFIMIYVALRMSRCKIRGAWNGKSAKIVPKWRNEGKIRPLSASAGKVERPEPRSCPRKSLAHRGERRFKQDGRDRSAIQRGKWNNERRIWLIQVSLARLNPAMAFAPIAQFLQTGFRAFQDILGQRSEHLQLVAL